MNKLKVLDYAIECINRYDKFKEGERVGNCDMCRLIPIKHSEPFNIGLVDCNRCPFGKSIFFDKVNHCNHKDYIDNFGCWARINGKNIKAWQKELIKRTISWCERELPEYTIEVV